MRRGFVAIILICWVAFSTTTLLNSCADTSAEKQPEKVSDKGPTVSELALLMRQMHEDAKTWRQQIINGDSLNNQPDYFAKLLIATPTEGRSPGQQTIFASQVAEYTGAGTALFDTTGTPLPEKYNILVTSCINCHKQLCPGLVKTIKKLYIPGN